MLVQEVDSLGILPFKVQNRVDGCCLARYLIQPGEVLVFPYPLSAFSTGILRPILDRDRGKRTRAGKPVPAVQRSAEELAARIANECERRGFVLYVCHANPGGNGTGHVVFRADVLIPGTGVPLDFRKFGGNESRIPAEKALPLIEKVACLATVLTNSAGHNWLIQQADALARHHLGNVLSVLERDYYRDDRSIVEVTYHDT